MLRQVTVDKANILAFSAFTIHGISAALRGKNDNVRQLQSPDDPLFDVVVSVVDACPTGTISVQVQDSISNDPVVGTDVSFLLAGKQTYEGNLKTDHIGLASFDFKAALEDATGEDLWCSIAIDNPWLPFSQQVPCSVNVCKQDLDPFFDVEVSVEDACPTGTISVQVQDSISNDPIVGTDVSFLLAGKQTYEGNFQTDQNGQASFNFTAALEDATRDDLWCSISIENPWLPFSQQVPCSVNVC